MLILEDILEKMKVHFPRWMDIRRKVKSSTGGLYLTSIAENISDIQSAIDDYKKDFFIDNYFGKEDDVIAFLYKVAVGAVDEDSTLTLITPEYTITEDENTFYDNEDYVYYNDGNLYFKKEEPSIIYSINSYKCEGTMEKIHVWNIFDEFAIFLGLKRYQWETNKELLDRILAFAKVRVNSTEDGLKNAILSNLVNIAPELKKEDILIERPTAENLVKYYDKYETILDHLSEVNRDVYREKQWDVDIWNFGLKSVEYIPHAWDVYLSEYVNGVGFKDDLKVEIVDDSLTTNVTVYFYKKQLAMINDYIKNNNIRQSFKFELNKFNQNIQTKNVKYRITASDAKLINTNNISFKATEEKTGSFNINLQDVIDPAYDKTNIIETDLSVLDSNFNYTLDFIPKDEIGDFEISYCKQGNINLLDPNYPGFEANGEGLVSTSIKKYITNLYQLTSYNNITKTINGFEIADLSKESSMTADVSGCAGKTIFYDYDYKETILDLNSFTMSNCYADGNTIVSDADKIDNGVVVIEPKVVNLNLIANTLSFKIEGPYKIKYTIDGGTEVVLEDKLNNAFDFNLGKSDMPKIINLSVELFKSGSKIKNIKYSKYEFKINTSKDSLITSGDLVYLPNKDLNTLEVVIKSYAGFSPILKYIYIGNKLSVADGYYGIAFNTNNGTKLNTKFENCRLQLKKFDFGGTLIETVNDYKPFIEYTARENVQIELDLTNYSITSFSVDNGSIEIDDINPINTKYILTILKGKTITSFTATGKCIKPIVDIFLSTVISNKGIQYADYDFYISKNENRIIGKRKSDGALKYITIYKEDLFNKLSTSTITVNCLDNNIVTKFIEEGGLSIYTNDNKSDYSSIAFEPSTGNTYVAINEHDVLLPYTKNIQVVNTFNNNFDPTATNPLFYSVESLNDEFNIRFMTNSAFENCDTKALNSTRLAIKAKLLGDMEYNAESTIIEQELLLSSAIEIPQNLTLANGSIIDIRKFVLNMDHTINYYNKYSDTENSLDYIMTDTITLDSSRVNKLTYSNVHEIERVIYGTGELKEDLDFYILKDQGIITWLNDVIPDNSTIVVTYNINVAKSFNVNLDDLYEKINFPVNSLELMSTAYVTNVKANGQINLNNYEDYAKSDLVSFSFSDAGFLSDLDNGILTLFNNTPKNSIAIKTGYYYMDGREFYLLANEKYDNIAKLDAVTYHNITKDNNSFILKQKSENFITNSTFDLDTKGNIFDLDCLDKDVEGISELNEITICESFNYWNSFASSLSITNGYNRLGLKFESLNNEDGYCYLPLSQFIKDNNTYVLSFYLSGGKAYLGKERNINTATIEFNQQSLIEIDKEIELSQALDNIYDVRFTNKEADSYYLILTGTGVIDDILLIEEDKYNAYNHIKNLTLLNLDVPETIYTNYNTRLYVTDKYSGILDGTEINEDNDIINSSYINWGYTNVKTFRTHNDFKKFILDNVDLLEFDNRAVVKTGSEAGTITTTPIYIGNTKIVKNLLYKINDVMFNDMKGVKITVLTSNSQESGYKEVLVSLENLNSIDGINLLPYVKLMVELPANRVINNIEIFIEYLAKDNNAPAQKNVSNGSYTSKVLDAQYTERYLIKALGLEEHNLDISNYTFQIRASKINDDNSVWTSWKDIELNADMSIANRIVFTDYRYFQFRVSLKGENASIKINHIDLEVI